MKGHFQIGRVVILGAGLCLLGLLGCADFKKKLALPAGADRAQLETRLQALRWDWEILQKDHPPQNQTGSFRLVLSRAEQDLAENKLRAAEADLVEGEAWMKEARPRYFQQHQEDVSGKATPEDGETLMGEAREFWKQAEAAEAEGKKSLAEKDRAAALEMAELAVMAHAGERERIYDYARLSLELADFYRRIGRESDAKRASEEGLLSVREAVADLSAELERDLAGQEEGFKPEQLRLSQEAFAAARTELEKKNQRLLALAERGSALFPGKVLAEDQTRRILDWAAPYQQYFLLLEQKNQAKTPAGDKARLAEKERQRLLKVRELSRVCDNAVPLSTPGLKIIELGKEPRGDQVVIKGRVINSTGHSIYKLAMAVCGEKVASEIIDLNKPELIHDNQEGFVIPLINYSLGDFMSANFDLGSRKLLLIYNDPQGVQRREYLSLP